MCTERKPCIYVSRKKTVYVLGTLAIYVQRTLAMLYRCNSPFMDSGEAWRTQEIAEQNN